MKKTTRIILATAICTTLATTTIFAKTGEVLLKAYYNNMQVTLDGEKVNLVDSNGNPVEPFIVDGTTYLPVRSIASALGLDVAYDSNTNTVKLGADYPSSGASLLDVDMFTSDYHKSYSFMEIDTYTSIVDTKFKNGYHFLTSNLDNEEATFDLKGKFERLTFTVVSGKENKGKSVEEITEDGAIEVWGDDTLIYVIDDFDSDTTEPIDISLNVENVEHLKIRYNTYTTYKRSWAIVNPILN